MNRRMFLGTAAVAPLVARTSASSTPSKSSTESSNPGSHAPIYERYKVTLARVLSGTAPAYTEVLADVRPTVGRRFTEYSGDLSGRYIGALATAARVYQTPFPNLDGFVARVVALQKTDGYFGRTFHYDKPTDEDLALLWGNGRLLVGLLEYYRYKPSPAVLSACQRLGEFLLRIAPLMLSKNIRDEFGAAHFASSYICWTQQTEGLAGLYQVTRDERYRLLTQQIAAVIERRPGDHVHGYLTSLRGVMDLYQLTAEARLLQQCEAAWQDVAQSEDLLITGGVPEGWSPNKHRTEGCAEADWVRLNLSLWKATAKPKYLEMAERATFNELALNQSATGDFGHRVFTDTGLSGDAAARAWWCCTLHGLRYFPDVQASAFRGKGGALYFDLPIDSNLQNGHVPSSSLSAISTSSLGQDGTVGIMITEAGESAASLFIRKPEWASAVSVLVNGSVTNSLLEGGYASIHRQWKRGDIVTVNYAMSLQSNSAFQKRMTFSHGPWLLGAPAVDNREYFNELTTDNRLAPIGHPVVTHPGRPFTVPVAATTFVYTPAEFPEQKGKITLRAIAEETGEPTTAWELRFLTDTAPASPNTRSS